MVAVGLGGRRAGLTGDVAFRLPPVTDVDADADELLDASPSVGTDLNPVHVMTTGAHVLDLRLKVERRSPLTSVRTW